MEPRVGCAVSDVEVLEVVLVVDTSELDDKLDEVEVAVVEELDELDEKIIEDDRSSSIGSFGPSSSSRESGARVQAGPGVSLLKVLLKVIVVVVVVSRPTTLHPMFVASITVKHVDDDDVVVDMVVETEESNVVRDTIEERSMYSPHQIIRSVAV
jgi:hypothetical protein